MSIIKYFPKIKDIKNAKNILKKIIIETPLQENITLSERYNARIFLKREDLQISRSYKIRGAYNKIKNINNIQKGVFCASAGNHAQGVAYSCNKLKIFGKIYMPTTTPKQKIERVKYLGKNFIDICLFGDTFDLAYQKALLENNNNKLNFIHPFDDPKVIEGQGTIGLEILNQVKTQKIHIDYIFIPIGGGGLISGVGSYFNKISPKTKIIGVEPEGAASMSLSINKGKVIPLKKIDRFVDGASVKKVGYITYDICKKIINEIQVIPEGKVCSAILDLYNTEAIIAEPAGALSIAVLDSYSDIIKGKNIVCIISGGNNDITRTEEIRERSLIYEGLKHYFIIRFPQRAGSLKQFVNEILEPGDDISYFQYNKKNSKEEGPAVIGIELTNRNNLLRLMSKMKIYSISFQYLNDNPDLLNILT